MDYWGYYEEMVNNRLCEYLDRFHKDFSPGEMSRIQKAIEEYDKENNS